MMVLRCKKGNQYRFWYHDVFPECNKFESNSLFAIDCLKEGFEIDLIGEEKTTINLSTDSGKNWEKIDCQESTGTTCMPEKLKYKTKVYWVNEFPNNGVGYFICKIPLINRILVRKRNGRYVIAHHAIELQVALHDKIEGTKNLKGTGNPGLYIIYLQNQAHIKEMESFLKE